MVDPATEIRGVGLDEPMYDDGMMMVQPTSNDDDTIVVRVDGKYVATSVPHLREIVEEGDAEYPEHHYNGRVEDDQIVLESGTHTIRTPEADAFIEELSGE